MIFVNDRIPTTGMENRFKATNETDGTTKYIKLERADNPVVEGTDVDRGLLMGLQGFYASTIVFGTDGVITETNADGDTLVTTFPDDAIAIDTFTQTSTGQTISLRTREDENGNVIKELI